MRSITKTKLAIFALLVLFVVLRLPSLIEPHWYGDEGIYAAVGAEMLRGELLYTETWDHKPPAIYLIYAATAGLGMTQLLALKLLNICAGLATVIFSYLVSRQLAITKNTSLLVALAITVVFGGYLVEANTVNAENFFVPLALAAIWAYLWLKDRSELWGVIMAGGLMGMALLFKFHPIFDAFALGLLMLFVAFKGGTFRLRSLQPALVYALFVFLPLALVALFYGLIGNFPEFFDAVFSYNLRYSEEFGGSQSGVMAFLTSIWGRLLILLLVIAAIAWGVISEKARRLDWKFGFLAIWLASTFFAVQISGRPYAHYLMQLVPALLIFSAYAAEQFTPLAKSIWKKVIIAGIIVIAINYFFISSFWQGYDPEFGYNSVNYYPIGFQLFFREATQGFPMQTVDDNREVLELIAADDLRRDWQRVFNNEAFGVYETGQFIEDYVDPGSEIYFWGNRAWVYQLTEVDNLSRFVVYFHVDDIFVEEEVEVLMGREEANSPRYLLIDSSYNLRSELAGFEDNGYEFVAERTLEGGNLLRLYKRV